MAALLSDLSFTLRASRAAPAAPDVPVVLRHPLAQARQLQAAVAAFVARPDTMNLNAARRAWLQARRGPGHPGPGRRTQLFVGQHPPRRRHQRLGIESGLLERLRRADLVICQAACINHEAHHRIKRHCERTGTPCMYMDRPSLSRLDRALAQPQPHPQQHPPLGPAAYG